MSNLAKKSYFFVCFKNIKKFFWHFTSLQTIFLQKKPFFSSILNKKKLLYFYFFETFFQKMVIFTQWIFSYIFVIIIPKTLFLLIFTDKMPKGMLMFVFQRITIVFLRSI